MTDINEVLERMVDTSNSKVKCETVLVGDVRAILADRAALKAEIGRVKREAGYTAADIATAAADGFRDGVASVDLEQFRGLLVFVRDGCKNGPIIQSRARILLALIDDSKVVEVQP